MFVKLQLDHFFRKDHTHAFLSSELLQLQERPRYQHAYQVGFDGKRPLLTFKAYHLKDFRGRLLFRSALDFLEL